MFDCSTPWTAAHQVSLSFTVSWSLLKIMSIESVIHPTISSSIAPFSPQPFPASGSFPRSWLFASDGQSIGVSASASVLPMNIQGSLPFSSVQLLVMSDSVQPHRRQPTRLLCPWDSPGKNTGVGCHFLLQCMKVKSESEVAQSCPTLG